jgi:hypothetical protein
MRHFLRTTPLAHKAQVALGIALLIGISLAGCMAPTHGTVSVYVRTNGHSDFTQVELTFTRVEVQRAGAGIGDGQDPTVDRGAGEEPSPQEMGIRTVTTTSRSVDLLQFQDQASRAHLGDDRIPAGTYSLIIMRVSEASGTLRDDGSNVAINLASNELRQSHEFTVEAGETVRLILEIDLEGGLSQNDQGQYRLSPRVSEVSVEPRASGAEEDVTDRGV